MGLLKHSLLAGAALLLLATGPARAAPDTPMIGVAALVQNSVTGALQDRVRTIKARDNVFFNEKISTGADGKTQFLFIDETVLSLGPESELTLDSMVYDPQTGTGTMVVNMSKGFLRFVSGALPSQSYRLNTPTTVIGVRGTIFDLIVQPGGQTTVVVEEGAVDMTAAASGRSVTVPAGKAATVQVNAAQPTRPAPPMPHMLNQIKGALTLTKTEGLPGGPGLPASGLGFRPPPGFGLPGGPLAPIGPPPVDPQVVKEGNNRPPPPPKQDPIPQ